MTANRKTGFTAITIVVILLASFAAGAGIMISNPHIQNAYAQTNPDSLFVGDAGDNTVKVVNMASTTSPTGKVHVPKTDGSNTYTIKGPRGIIMLDASTLLLVNQNANTGTKGDLIKFDSTTGEFLGFLVKHDNPNAPFAPRGAVLSPDKQFVYVASLDSSENNGDMTPGWIYKYQVSDGKFVTKFDWSSLSAAPNIEFHPRALVSGADGKIYVSVVNDLFKDGKSGSIVRFDPTSDRFDNTYIVSDSLLHRPEGLAFSPDGKLLWVASYRADSKDIDRLLAFDANGKKRGEIDLDKAGEPRAFAQAILFGPNGNLFVPISGPGPSTTGGPVDQYTGELRLYTDLHTPGTFSVVSIEEKALQEPWYLSFQATNPSNLNYSP